MRGCGLLIGGVAIAIIFVVAVILAVGILWTVGVVIPVTSHLIAHLPGQISQALAVALLHHRSDR